ncbi:hypothetical protein AAFF_G00177560 [Aldrovandia affinis]|uniref:Bardet-Biedl syndrome 10 protein n=1 Tax=Aldrovandia affinis TaxID=143900 RepID=A0AAD7W6Y3_9TELE|nr:hypothetical protein AAFF_G00177560 [Aldrovandia affinis]
MARVEVGTLLQIAEALEAVVGRCFGPNGGQVLFTRDTGEVLITRDGWKILTSLQLDHPVARVLVDCVSAHCETTGDGAKTFVLLLAALLRGVQAGRLQGLEARRVALALHSFQTQVLDGVIRRHVAPLASSLLPWDPVCLGLLTQAYFQGKVTSAHCSFLSEMACEFYRRWRCRGDPEGAALISRHFAQLHTTVPGLPVSRSRVLEGLVIHRDFAVRCRADGPLRALAVAVPMHPPLAPTGVTLSLASHDQVQRCCSWLDGRVELGIASMRRLQVRLLISGVKQSALVLDHAQRAGVSVVECVDGDELALFCHLSGAKLFDHPGDWSLIREEYIATVMFCQPVVLGPDRFAHVGFREGRGLLPHCLALCGPVPGMADQCVSAFRGAVRMLQRVFEPVQSHHQQSGEEANENTAIYTVKRPNLHNKVGLHCTATSIGDNANLNTQFTANERLQALLRCPDKSLGPLCAGQSQPRLNTETEAEPKDQTSDRVQNGKAPGTQPGDNFGNEMCSDVLAVSGVTLGSHTHKLGSASSGVLIEAGSLLPVGGTFEFLLHHYLLQHTSQTSCPDTQAACRLVAGAMLCVPRQLYSGKRFLEAQSRFTRTLTADPTSERVQGLESLACKYQLVVSALQGLRTLLSVDVILHTSVRCQKERGREKGEEEEEEEDGDGDGDGEEEGS